MRTVPSVATPAEPLPVRLMNTVRAGSDGLVDTLACRADLVRWLEDAGHAGTPVSAADLDRYRALRDALRTLAGIVTGGPADSGAAAAAVRLVNAVAAGVGAPRLQLRAGRPVPARPPGRAADALRAAIAAQAVALLGADDGALRACGAPGCVLFFVRNHPRQEWCSTTCGNRVRAARAYSRARARA